MQLANNKIHINIPKNTVCFYSNFNQFMNQWLIKTPETADGIFDVIAQYIKIQSV
jgi:hypothetical protein